MIRTQLKKILSSDVFARTERLSSFLNFVVEQSLNGQADSLKEQVLAVELYGKRSESDDDDYPPVRNDARRLRDKLREYYVAAPDDPVIVMLPKGGYRPVFEHNPASRVPTNLPKPERLLEGPAAQPATAPWRRRQSLLAAGLLVSAAGAVLWMTGAKSEPAVWSATPLSVLPGAEGPPSLSPDGKFVAFAWSGSDDPAPTDIYIKAVESDALRKLTDTPFSESNPAWSPDGTQIAFCRAPPDRGVYIVSQLGGMERKISNSGDFVRWTPDGKSLVIRDTPNGPTSIVEISLDTRKRRLVTPTPLGSRDVWFDVSPDGKTLAFIREQHSAVGDLYVVPMSGGEPQRRTNFDAANGPPVWSPNGREVIVNLGYGYPTTLWRVPAFGSRLERGVPIRLSTTANSVSISRPAPGQPARLAFTVLQMDSSLRLLDLEAPLKEGVIQADKPLFETSTLDYPGSFSHDGNQIAFNSSRPAEGVPWVFGFAPDQLWLGGRDGKNLRQFTRMDSPGIRSPSWSPDGRRIAFESTIRGNTDVYVMDVEGGEPQRLTFDPSIQRLPSWSGDGRTIYFCSNETGRGEIWKLTADGGPAVQITRDSGDEPIESLDGKHVYCLFFDRTTRFFHLKRVSVRGGEETILMGDRRVGKFNWAVTEKGIIFTTPTPEFDALDLYQPTDGKVTRLGRLPFRVSRLPNIDRLTVSRDGRWGLTVETTRLARDLAFVDSFR